MKPNADALTYDQIVEMMRGAIPRRVTGPPASDAETAAETAKMEEIIAAGGVRFQCVSCGGAIEPKDMAQCECGGFVCPACRRVEEEGVCDHEAPDYAQEDDDD